MARVREASWKPQQRVERDLLSEEEQGVSRLVRQIASVKPECRLRALKKRRGSSSHFLTSKDSAQTTIPLVILMVTIPVFAQNPPPSPDRPWHTYSERQITNDGKHLRQLVVPIEPDRAYSLAELIDLAEAHNPETRVAWENARAQAATSESHAVNYIRP
jgi:hypothetical protein